MSERDKATTKECPKNDVHKDYPPFLHSSITITYAKEKGTEILSPERLCSRGQSRFSAFFLFSMPVGPEDVAERLTALVVGVGAGPIPIELLSKLALAVPSGAGEARRSLLSLSPDKDDAEVAVGSVLAGDDWRGCEGGAGDFRVDATVEGDVEVEGIESDVSGRFAAVMVGAAFELDVEGTESNSTGLVRGVACILVINFALEQ